MVIVTYGCYVASTTPPMISNEHKRAGLFTHDEVPDLNMPDGYKRSTMTWCRLPRRCQHGDLSVPDVRPGR